ncbi:hypothetical protein, partial [Pseudomonas sp. MPR-AND1A]|uniref:hypothetical protein n=1 Tax=Pseudomonas sp. MPR-AND1A TaxID=2070600 RepID=UPI000CC6F39B
CATAIDAAIPHTHIRPIIAHLPRLVPIPPLGSSLSLFYNALGPSGAAIDREFARQIRLVGPALPTDRTLSRG